MVSNFFGFLAQNAMVVLIFASLGISGVSWIMRKLSEQAEFRRIDIQRREQSREMIRTGRTQSPQARVSAELAQRQARLEQIAAQRQAQLEQLRQRRKAQLQQLRQGSAAIAGVPTASPARQPQSRQTPVPAARAPMPSVPRPAAPSVRPTPITAPASRRARPQQQAQSRPTPKPAPSRKPRQNLGGGVRAKRAEFRQRHLNTRDQVKAPPKPAFSLLGPLDRHSMRRAIVMAEVIGPPVSMRPPSSMPNG